MSWTEPQHITARWVGAGEPDDTDLLQQLIDDAEETIRWEHPDIGDRVVDDEESGESGDLDPDSPLPIQRVQMVVARMVIRHLRNPDGTRQTTETEGPFSRNRTFAGERPGELFLHDEERRMLGYRPGAPSPKAFTIPYGGSETPTDWLAGGLKQMAGETVWILPRHVGDTDTHGNPVYTWPHPEESGESGEPEPIRVDGVKIAPRTDLSGEAAIADREAVVTNKRLLMPAGSARPEPVDRMFVRDEVYEVIGEPGVWRNPWRDAETGIEVALKRVEG